MVKEKLHTPVMCKELIEYLKLNRGATVVDCTVGSGGHAEALLKEVGSQGKLVGLDQDRRAIELTKNRLEEFNNCVFLQGNFRNVDAILARLKIDRVDGIIFDLGLSSLQLDSEERGFSIRQDGPLDMRMDKDLKLSAFDLVNFLPEIGLSDILRKYGEERWHNRIARAIVKERKKSMLASTAQLANLVQKITPRRYSKIHPATRTFQALRIAVNDELEALREGLNKCIRYLRPGARMCVLSFHSLEDRIVKHQFREFAREGLLKIITKKPLRPCHEEISLNPRARSAKLRVAERINEGRRTREEGRN